MKALKLKALSKERKISCRAYDQLYIGICHYIKTRCKNDLKNDSGQKTRIETAISFIAESAVKNYFK